MHSDYAMFRFHKSCCMDRLIKVLCLITCMTIPATALAGNKGDKKSSGVNWEPVMNAIIQVESGGRSKAKNGNQCGAMQITPILVKECNNILKERKSKKRFTLSDRFDVKKSKEMFLLIQSYHNPKNDIEKAIRSWNGGQQYSVKRTQRYFEKVMSYL